MKPFKPSKNNSNTSNYSCIIKLALARLKMLPTNYSYLPTPPLGQDMTQGQFFKAEFNRFEFRVFLLLD